MIYHVSDAVLEERFQMRGGNGTVQINNLMPKEGLPAHCRLFATITLQPGCSIGSHVHEDECEIFSFTQGAGRFLDNGNWTPVQAGDVTTTGSSAVVVEAFAGSESVYPGSFPASATTSSVYSVAGLSPEKETSTASYEATSATTTPCPPSVVSSL